MIGQILDISIHVCCVSGHMGTLICKLTLNGISRCYRNFVMPVRKVVQVAHWWLANFWVLDNHQNLYAFTTFCDWIECIESKTEINETYHCQPKLPKIYSWCTIFLSGSFRSRMIALTTCLTFLLAECLDYATPCASCFDKVKVKNDIPTL